MRPLEQERSGAPQEEGMICPECGEVMVLFDRLEEDGAVFIWYACPVEGCVGQWLTKKDKPIS